MFMPEVSVPSISIPCEVSAENGPILRVRVRSIDGPVTTIAHRDHIILDRKPKKGEWVPARAMVKPKSFNGSTATVLLRDGQALGTEVTVPGNALRKE
jgi:hypothetical protein